MFSHSSLTMSGGYVPPPVLKIEPGDIIAIQMPEKLNIRDATELGEHMKSVFKSNTVVVLSNGSHIKAIRPEA